MEKRMGNEILMKFGLNEYIVAQEGYFGQIEGNDLYDIDFNFMIFFIDLGADFELSLLR